MEQGLPRKCGCLEGAGGVVKVGVVRPSPFEGED